MYNFPPIRGALGQVCPSRRKSRRARERKREKPSEFRYKMRLFAAAFNCPPLLLLLLQRYLHRTVNYRRRSRRSITPLCGINTDSRARAIPADHGSSRERRFPPSLFFVLRSRIAGLSARKLLDRGERACLVGFS